MKIFYLCDRNNHCPDPCWDECFHTTIRKHSKNFKEHMPILMELVNPTQFKAIAKVDEFQFWEREQNILLDRNT